MSRPATLKHTGNLEASSRRNVYYDTKANMKTHLNLDNAHWTTLVDRITTASDRNLELLDSTAGLAARQTEMALLCEWKRDDRYEKEGEEIAQKWPFWLYQVALFACRKELERGGGLFSFVPFSLPGLSCSLVMVQHSLTDESRRSSAQNYQLSAPSRARKCPCSARKCP